MTTNHENIQMYFDPEVAKDFVELQQNPKNRTVSEIISKTSLQVLDESKPSYHIANLGAGAHIDRYDDLFHKFIHTQSNLDWVDISPYMIALAQEYANKTDYQDRQQVLNFVVADMEEYLNTLPDNSLDLAIMQYSLDHFASLDKIFTLLHNKLKPEASLVSTIKTNPELKSYGINARYLYNGQEFPDDETRTMQDGSSYTIKFFKVSGDRFSGFTKGAEQTVFYHSAQKIQEIASSCGFEVFLGDWKQFHLNPDSTKIDADQEILVLTKK